MKTTTFSNTPSLKHLTVLRGSLITLRRRCAKPNCHCAKGNPHESPALSFSQAAKTRILTLTASEVPIVRRALKEYRRSQGRLTKEADRGLRLLERYLKLARRH